MVTAQWEIHPRNADLSRTLDPISRWTSLELVERFNAPSTWVLTGPASALAAFTPGMGCIVDRNGKQLVSGQVRSFGRNYSTDPDTGRVNDTITLGFVEDTDELWSRLLWPDPSIALLTGASRTFPVTHDVRTGTAEARLLAYVAAHLGPAANLTTRRLSTLRLPVSGERGPTGKTSARMLVLGDVVAALAEEAGLRVQIAAGESGGAHLALTLTPVTNVSENVVFGDITTARATAFVSEWDYQLDSPTLTDAVVFAAGSGTARLGYLFSDAAVRTMWGRRREVLVDQRQTSDATEITAAGTEALKEGQTPVRVSFTVADSADVIYGRDYALGWRVGVELPGLPVAVADNTVREATWSVSADQPETCSIVVGTPGVTENSTKQAQRLAAAMRAVSTLQGSQ